MLEKIFENWIHHACFFGSLVEKTNFWNTAAFQSCFSLQQRMMNSFSMNTVRFLCFINFGVISGINFHVFQNAIFFLPEIDKVVWHLPWAWKKVRLVEVSCPRCDKISWSRIKLMDFFCQTGSMTLWRNFLEKLQSWLSPISISTVLIKTRSKFWPETSSDVTANTHRSDLCYHAHVI